MRTKNGQNWARMTSETTKVLYTCTSKLDQNFTKRKIFNFTFGLGWPRRSFKFLPERWFVEKLVDLFFNTKISLIRNPYFPANRQSDENPRWYLVSSNIFLIILSKKRKIFSICVRYQISKDAQDFDGFRFPFFSTSRVAMAASREGDRQQKLRSWDLNQSAKPDWTLIQNRS